MWSVLRLAARSAVVGLLGVVVAMISMGLAIVALDDDRELTLLAWIPFGIAAVFGVLFIGAWLYLSYEAAVVGRKIRELRGHIRSGLNLKAQIFDKVIQGGDEAERAWDEWREEVALWIKNEEPTYISDFEIAHPGMELTMTTTGIDHKATRVAHYVDAELGALRELLSDLRARR